MENTILFIKVNEQSEILLIKCENIMDACNVFNSLRIEHSDFVFSCIVSESIIKGGLKDYVELLILLENAQPHSVFTTQIHELSELEDAFPNLKKECYFFTYGHKVLEKLDKKTKFFVLASKHGDATKNIISSWNTFESAQEYYTKLLTNAIEYNEIVMGEAEIAKYAILQNFNCGGGKGYVHRAVNIETYSSVKSTIQNTQKLIKMTKIEH